MDLVAVGDLTLDIKTAPMSGVPERDTQKIVDDLFLELGGETANCAVAAAALGMETRLIAKAGSDLFGNWLLDYLKKAGVEAKVNADPAVKTSTTLALCFDDSSRSFISTQESNNSLSLEDVDFELVEGGHLHRGGYWNCASLLGGPTEKLFRHAVDNGMETSLDIGWDHGGWTDERKEGVFKILENCTILFINPHTTCFLINTVIIRKTLHFFLKIIRVIIMQPINFFILPCINYFFFCIICNRTRSIETHQTSNQQ